MKKIIITMLVALLVIATTQAKPVVKVTPKKHATEQVVDQNDAAQDEVAQDEAVEDNPDAAVEEAVQAAKEASEKPIIDKDGIIIFKDGETVKVKFSDMNRIIKEHLDDTLINEDGLTIDTSDGRGMEVGSAEYNFAQDGMNLARDITTYLTVGAVFIVFFSLLFYYMHRRRRYKTVDRAIQAGYPLPDEFFGKRTPVMPQQPTTVYVNQIIPPTPDPNAPQGTQPAVGNMPPHAASGNSLNTVTDWSAFKNGFVTTAVGLGLMFFFLIAGMEAVAALMLIVIFVGVGKIFLAYQEQRNVRNFWQQQQWAQPQQPQQQQYEPQQPQQPQQWQQWNQQPQDVPPMPETPPEFRQ